MTPPPPSLETLLAFAPLDASPLAVVAVGLAALYLYGAARLWVRRRRWSIPRTISFLLGCIVLFLVSALGVNRYATELVSALLFQQITLMTVVPPLLIAGSPGRLLLRATPHRGLGRAVLRVAHAGLRSGFTRVLLHPAVAVLVAAAFYFGLYLSDLVSVLIVLPLGHELLLAVLLTGGIVAAVPLWSSDPLPRTPSYGARLVDVLVEIQIHAVFGLILLRTGTPLFSAFADPPPQWEVDPLFDQALGGTLAWTYAELPLLVVLIVTLSRWRNRDNRLARLRQDQEDADLEQYNAYLAALSQARPRPAPGSDAGREPEAPLGQSPGS